MTSNVIPLRRPVVEPTAGELAEQVAVLAELVIEFARDAEMGMRRRLADLEARTPKPRFTIPPGWIAFKTAVAESGPSLDAISQNQTRRSSPSKSASSPRLIPRPCQASDFEPLSRLTRRTMLREQFETRPLILMTSLRELKRSSTRRTRRRRATSTIFAAACRWATRRARNGGAGSSHRARA